MAELELERDDSAIRGSLYSLDWTTGLDYWTGFSQQCGLPEQRRC